MVVYKILTPPFFPLYFLRSSLKIGYFVLRPILPFFLWLCFIIVVKSLKIRTKEMTEVTGITMLSDGSLLIYGSNRYVSNPRRILQYDWNTEDIIYAKDVDTKGAIEIRKDGYPFLLVSDG